MSDNWRMADLHAKEAPDRVESLKPGEQYWTGHMMDEYCSGISVDINIQGLHASEIELVLR